MCAAATMLHSDQLKASEIKAGNPERPEALARGAPESEQTEEAKAAFGALEKRRPEH